ncbi:alcohol dehydrogenase catalytic domain-containing protein [Nocardioides plantarum]|uniref:alcohol dehydrogenase n=1 Tax=Nocardioides plantarum TaxID=29299 RepID=A0ABV5KEU5_9ACTN|nr:alcohol dehydrogenase catalytic domain-containing protein [Nocardioides plantarum]
MNAPLPSRMLAVRLERWASQPVLTEVDVPAPGPDEVLLRVDAAGLCHSDLHVIDGAAGVLPYELPFTLGHEVAGTVVATGRGVADDWTGAPVAVHGIWSCGECRACLRGRDNYCLRLAGGPIGGGLGYDGGLAEYVLVPSTRHLVQTMGLSPVDVAPLTDGGLTALHAVGAHRHLAEGGTVLLVGAGGLGHLALQLIAATPGARVVVVDNRAAARDLALRLGAHGVAATVAEGARLLATLGLGSGVDLVLDFVGAPATLADVPHVLAPGGTVAVIGSAGGALEAAKGRGLPPGWRFDAPFWGPHADLEAIIALAATGHIQAETTTYALEDALTAYDDLRAGRVAGRAVVVPHELPSRL